jgi:hypothetical protein
MVIDPGSSSGSTFTWTHDSFYYNQAQGGAGGSGSSATAAAGNGGAGGLAGGGAIEYIPGLQGDLEVGSASGAVVALHGCSIYANTAVGGAGGAGGSGIRESPGGLGGNGGTATGGGLDTGSSYFDQLEQPFLVDSSTFQYNSAVGGNGGAGGGNGGDALGAGLFVNVAGDFEIIRSTIVRNGAAHGNGGAAQSGQPAGNNGTADGGGIYVYYVEQEIGTGVSPGSSKTRPTAWLTIATS